MPRIFDNIEQRLLLALRRTLEHCQRADFCVGYFNLRGWKHLGSYVEHFEGGEGRCCRLLVGMHKSESQELREVLRLDRRNGRMDQGTAVRLRKQLAEEFGKQLALGAPRNDDEHALRLLAKQLREEKVQVKLFLRHPLHAKLYLLHQPHNFNLPTVGFLGSSNLTFSGLSGQGELNVDVVDHDACDKLTAWFEDKWNDRWCVDITEQLVQVIEESWAREELVQPYHVYLKIAYHLAHEARMGLREFKLPQEFRHQLFDYQAAAVRIAARHLSRRGGVLLGDVVGLGKTLMATALARIFEDDFGLETLIICPKNLVKMWEDYQHRYRLRARVLSITKVRKVLPELPRYRLIIIDESHNLRNREGKRYRAIQDYIQRNDAHCILLTATPYNKAYLDLSNQIRLFVPEDHDLGIRPETLMRKMGEVEFERKYQAKPRTLAAFEKSDEPDDWRDLMRLFLVRRTRSFIKDHYALADGHRKYLQFPDGSRSYFPVRQPRTVAYVDNLPDGHPDPYAKLYAVDVVETIGALRLPRYGLGRYVREAPKETPSASEEKVLANLSRAGKRLIGFCRINLFKRLESSGYAFLLSLERHLLRNYVIIFAIEHGLDLPIGSQDAAMLDPGLNDEDSDSLALFGAEVEEGEAIERVVPSHEVFDALAERIYRMYKTEYAHRFKWLRPELFKPSLARDLRADAGAILDLLQRFGRWEANADPKLNALYHLISEQHPDEKVLVFSQFADTADYLTRELKRRGIKHLEGVTGDTEDPTELAWRFSPVSNGRRQQISDTAELRILLSTDVLSEGQNLQDAHIVVNYDLPWALIRLVQRAGRVDRIGQQAEVILCYSFLPAEGVEKIIRLRERVRRRLQENAEVVGADEVFFEDSENHHFLVDLYNEKAKVLDDEDDQDVDLASQAYQIWRDATKDNPSLQTTVESLPPVVYATKPNNTEGPPGVLVYLQTADGYDALTWVDEHGRRVTESQFAILKAAACDPDTAALPRLERHHELVQTGVEGLLRESSKAGGQLGRPSGARFKTYERLKRYAEHIAGSLFETDELRRAIEDVYQHPLTNTATGTLNRHLRNGLDDRDLVDLVLNLRREDRLVVHHEEGETKEPQIICSLGLAPA